jgi:excinuclease ABC subunit A
MKIKIRGARTHNLKNVQVDIPRDQLTVITGLSGSGKSSLAFDTLYAEGQRRYVESLSAYARQFLSMMEKPDVDVIEGLSPAIAIEQKATSHNPRSTVGTTTEIYDYLRLLFARVGEPYCPVHHVHLNAKTISEMVDQVLEMPQGARIMILAPCIRDRKGEHSQLFQQLQAQGYVRVRIDGVLYEMEDLPRLNRKQKHTIEVVVDRLVIREDIVTRLSESFESALRVGDGLAIIASMDQQFPDILLSSNFSCPECGYCLSELEPRLFSFNNPAGACPTCDGLGVETFFDPTRVIRDDALSLAEGAIAGWDRHTTYYFKLLERVAAHYDFSLDVAFSALPVAIKDILLYGEKEIGFEGIIPNLTRRYRDSDSLSMKEYLSKYLSSRPCPECLGSRLKQAARFVFVQGKALSELVSYSIDELYLFFQHLSLTGHKQVIAQKITHEIMARLGFLIDVGLEYLSLSRPSETLSGGEAQRIRLASQIGSGLVGVMYVLDEPSIGLHQRDNARLLKTLTHLRDLGNTVIVVEHDEDAIMTADHVIDVGPGAGVHGGEIVAEGSPAMIMAHPTSLTGQYLSRKKGIAVPQQRVPYDDARVICLKGVSCNNLNGLDVSIPVGLMTCVTGVSGSGKSSLINDTLFPLASTMLNRAKLHLLGRVQDISGFHHCDKVIDIDQSPIGRTPRSNPATYTGLFTPIRELFAATPEARARGYQPGRFSFNVKGGRCEACQGDGLIKVEMHFLPDMYVTCDACKGKRYNRETLEVHYKGKTIHEVLEMTVEEACAFFSAVPVLARKCETLLDVGLSYLRIGQSATTLSGGEAQRIKLARELSKRDTGKTLYILDEPTTGLHFHDTKQLLSVLFRLRDKGNTIVVIEHNLDVIKTADWIIDLGPEGGSKGGQIVAVGTPESVSECAESFTGQFLKPLLANTYAFPD